MKHARRGHGARRQPRLRQALSHAAIVTASVVLSLLALELLVRWFALDSGAASGEPSFAVFTSHAPVFALSEENGRRIYRRTRHHWIPGPQQFPAEKAPGTIRIFGLGGSAAMGWPHPPEQSYLGFLRRKLQRLYPDRPIEVINVAGNTYASYRVRGVLNEILAYEPDLILIYSGNNEFLEDFVYRDRRLAPPWNAFALARLVHRRLAAEASRPAAGVGDYGRADRTSTRLAFAFGRAARVREDPQQFRRVIEQYRDNMDAMVRAAKERGVPVMLLDVPVNLKDWTPNVSLHAPDMNQERLTRFRERFRSGLEHLEEGDTAPAVAVLEEAVRLDPGYANAHYRLAQALHRSGDLEAAREAYVAALETDAYPFRSLPAFDAVRREVAKRHEVPLVEARSALARAAVDHIPGLDVLVDYVHPTVASNELIAHEVLVTMDAAGLLPPPRSAAIGETRIPLPPDAEDTLAVLFALQSQYLIMRQYDHIDWISDRLLAAAHRDVRAHPEHQKLAQLVEERVRMIRSVIEPYRRLLHAEEVGVLQQQFTREQAQAIYRDYIEMIRRLEAGKLRPEEFEKFVPELQYGEP